MSQVGASLEQLDALAAEFRRQSAAAASLRSAIVGRLGETEWIGASAQAFRDRWSQDYDPMLRRLEQDLTELGGYVGRKREQLNEAGNL
jgi:uncharacterized protein YukE